MAKIIHERDRCIGCGACVSMCPDYWTMGDDGKSDLKKAVKVIGTDKYELKVDDLTCNNEAADACPVQCIFVSEK